MLYRHPDSLPEALGVHIAGLVALAAVADDLVDVVPVEYLGVEADHGVFKIRSVSISDDK